MMIDYNYKNALNVPHRILDPELDEMFLFRINHVKFHNSGTSLKFYIIHIYIYILLLYNLYVFVPIDA